MAPRIRTLQQLCSAMLELTNQSQLLTRAEATSGRTTPLLAVDQAGRACLPKSARACRWTIRGLLQRLLGPISADTAGLRQQLIDQARSLYGVSRSGDAVDLLSHDQWRQLWTRIVQPEATGLDPAAE